MVAQLTFDCNKTALGEHLLPSKRPQPPPSHPRAFCIRNLFQMSKFFLHISFNVSFSVSFLKDL